MPNVKFYLGNVGSGKTYKIYESLIKEEEKYLHDNSYRDLVIVVPEQHALQAQETLINVKYKMNGEQGAKKAVFTPTIMSFKKLAYSILGNTIGDDFKHEDDVSKMLLIRRIILDMSKKDAAYLAYLKIGNIQALTSAISEFEQYGIDEDTLDEAIKQLDISRDKKHELLKKLYSNYILEQEKENICFDVLSEAVKQLQANSDMYKDAVFAFDEFNGFTSSQLEFIKVLGQRANRLIFSLTAENENIFDEKNHILDSGRDLFYPAIRTHRDIKKILTESKIEYEVCDYEMECNNNFTHEIQKNLLRDSAAGNNKLSDFNGLKIASFISVSDEIREVCQQILYLVRQKKYKFEDIAVVSADNELYAREFKPICDSFGINLNVDLNKEIKNHALILLVMSILQVIDTNFSTNSIIRLVKNPLFPMKDFPSFKFENDLLEKGVRGIDGLKDYIDYYNQKMLEYENEDNSLDDMAKGYGIEEIKEKAEESPFDKTVIEILNPIIEVFMENDIFNNKKKVQAREITEALKIVLGSFDLEKRMCELAYDVDTQNNVIRKREYLQFANNCEEVLIDIFGKLEKLNKNEIGIADYKDLLQVGIENSKIRDIPMLKDAVILKDMMRSRHRKPYKAVFIVGMNDEIMPKLKDENLVIGSSLRKSLEEIGCPISESYKDDIKIQNFELYRNMLMATDKLYLSYPETSCINELLRPSYLIYELGNSLGVDLLNNLDEIKSTFADDENKTNPDLLAQNKNSAFLALGLDFLDENTRKIIESSLKSTEYYDAIKWSKNGLRHNEKISEELSKDLFAKFKEKDKDFDKGVRRFSISQVEKFAGCPFSYFCNYSLGLKERKVHKLSTADLGSLYHFAMEIIQKSMLKNGIYKFNAKNISDYVDAAYRIAKSKTRYLDKFANRMLDYNEFMIKRILNRTVEMQYTQMNNNAFYLYSVEQRLDWKLKNGIWMTGIVDRVDVTTDDKYGFAETDTLDGDIYKVVKDVSDYHASKDLFRIIDYKSGRKEIVPALLTAGVQIQLPIYLGAMQEWLDRSCNKSFEMAGMFYCHIKDEFINRLKTISDDEKRIKDYILEGMYSHEGDVINDLSYGAFLSGEYGKDHKSKTIKFETTKAGEISKTITKKWANEIPSLDAAVDIARKKLDEYSDEIISGKIKVDPLLLRASFYDACKYCKFKNICFKTGMVVNRDNKMLGETVNLFFPALKKD